MPLRGLDEDRTVPFGRTCSLRHRVLRGRCKRNALSTLNYQNPHNSDRIGGLGFDASLPGGTCCASGQATEAAIVEVGVLDER